jgi:hypothetical protein
LAHRNPPVVSVHSPRAAEPEPEVAAPTEVAVAAAVPAAIDAAKKEEPKKEEIKKDAAPAKKEGGKK